jgi:hypothetical protein
MGAVERGGKLRLRHVPDAKIETIGGFIRSRDGAEALWLRAASFCGTRFWPEGLALCGALLPPFMSDVFCGGVYNIRRRM